MNSLWEALLRESSPRYADWYRVLGTNRVPLKSPQSITARFGDTPHQVYLLDMKQLKRDQLERLVDHLAAKFKSRPVEVRAEIEHNGHFPIREQDVIVSFDTRAFI